MHLIYILIAFVAGIGVAWFFGKKVVTVFANRQTAKKEGGKERILALMRNGGEIGNDEIRELLGVSRQTATRYMDELEAEGKVRQVGTSGQSVTYRLL